MNEKRPEIPTKVRSFIMGRLLLEIGAGFRESCNILDEANQEKQEVLWNGEGWRESFAELNERMVSVLVLSI